MKTGLLGRKLGHSYSPQIHACLGSYSYDLFEKEPDEVETFLKTGDFTAINVTIPYKQTVIPFCSELSQTARRIGAVNTIVRREDGSLIGHNTDYFGFLSTVKHSGLDPYGKKVLIIGNGGASKPAITVMEELGARVTVITHKENTPENLRKHDDAAILVNATPVGMYPNTGLSPVDLSLFPRLEGVLDMIYNPARTQLLLDAEERGLITENGLWMLVAQAKEASEWFTGSPIDDALIGTIHQSLRLQMENIILIGMPGSGKSTIGRYLAAKLSKEFVDADAKIVSAAGMTIPEIFSQSGEAGFRQIESKVLSDLGKYSGLIIATGGGCVTRECNYAHLHQNGTIFCLDRQLSKLPTDGRPLSQKGKLEEMYRIRHPLYQRFADYTVDNNDTPDNCVRQILRYLNLGGKV